MDQRTVQMLFILLRSAIIGEQLNNNDKNNFLPKMLPDLMKISSKHDVSHLLAWTLKKNTLLPEEAFTSVENSIFVAVYRYENLRYEYESICNTLENAQIPFLPLKGSVIRQYYPEPWMRTSCDIDILVKEEDLSSAVDVLKKELAYTPEDDRNYHDISLHSPNGVHLELHFSIKENIASIDKLLSEVWSYTVLSDGTKYQYRQTNEYLIFHHIAHMSYHFINGGCGIKPFLDLYLMRQKIEFDQEKVYELCKICNLDLFYDNVIKLTEVWFEGKPHNDLTEKMQTYILSGGVYGSLENKVASKQGESGGKVRYALSRIFLSSKVLANYYPCVQKHIWLAPFCQIHRWFRIFISRNRFKQSVNELKSSNSVSKDKVNEMTQLLNEIGLRSEA